MIFAQFPRIHFPRIKKNSQTFMKMVRPELTLITLKVDEGNTMCCTNTLQKWDVFELDKMR